MTRCLRVGTTRSGTRVLWLAAILLAACGGERAGAERDVAVGADTTGGAEAGADTTAGPARPQGAYPAAVPAGWDATRLPPAEALVRSGACPFECCQYGTWWSDSTTVVYRTVRDTADVAFTVPPRTRLTAADGIVFVTSLARVVFDAPMDSAQAGVPGVAFTPADTLYLVEPVGEGAFIVWLRGRELELPGIWEPYHPGTTARLEGTYARAWWARVLTEDGRDGWVWMDRTRAPMWGADACAGPPEG